MTTNLLAIHNKVSSQSYIKTQAFAQNKKAPGNRDLNLEYYGD